MTAINFPSTPATGEIFTTANGVTYQFDGTSWNAINTTYATGGFRKLDNIASQFNGSTLTFDLTSSGIAVTPGNAQNLIIVVGGVPQEPITAYTVSSTSITFTSAPTAGMSFYGVILGDVMNIGVPSDGAVTSAKLDTNITVAGNLSVNGTTTLGNANGDTVVLNASTITLNNSTNISAASTKTLTLNGGAGSNGLVIDASNNIGLSVTPSAWGSTGNIQLGNGKYISAGGAYLHLSTNAHYTSGATVNYITSDVATRYSQYNGTHQWYIAPSGTAGNLIAFTQAMMLDASGKLGIGTTSPTNTLHVAGSIRNVGADHFIETNLDSVGAYSVAVQKSRGTYASKTAVISGDVLGSIAGHGYDGTAFVPRAGMRFEVDGAVSASTVPTAITFRTGTTTTFERARIDSSGNVLIGTTSQYGSQVLNVNGGIAINGRNATTPGLSEKGDTSTGIFWPSTSSIAISTASTERMRVDTTQVKTLLPLNVDGGMYAPVSGSLGGSYSANTWYSVTNSSVLTTKGIYVIEYLASTHNAGGALYDWYACTVPFAWNPTYTNSSNAFTFPSLMGSGHADNGQSQSISFRLRQTPGAADGKSYIEFSSTVALSGIDGTGGKNVILSVRRIA